MRPMHRPCCANVSGEPPVVSSIRPYVPPFVQRFVGVSVLPAIRLSILSSVRESVPPFVLPFLRPSLHSAGCLGSHSSLLGVACLGDFLPRDPCHTPGGLMQCLTASSHCTERPPGAAGYSWRGRKLQGATRTLFPASYFGDSARGATAVSHNVPDPSRPPRPAHGPGDCSCASPPGSRGTPTGMSSGPMGLVRRDLCTACAGVRATVSGAPRPLGARLPAATFTLRPARERRGRA